MNATPAPLSVLLLQWSLLLAAGWGVHALLRNRDPRWRLLLWRGILCSSVAITFFGFLPVPRLMVTPPKIAAAESRLTETHSIVRLLAGVFSTRDSNSAVVPALSASSTMPVSVVTSVGPGWRVSRRQLLLAVWLAGCCWEGIRLLRVQRRLRQISGQALEASSSVQAVAVQIQRELNIQRRVRVCISDAVSAPFLCGIFKPVIVMPRHLTEDLPPAQLNALLSHEMAHECRRDLAWCVAWRLVRVICWFHPLVWRAPDAHVLACEEEADRIAANRRYEGEYYARLLAQLTLRVICSPRAEQPLALSATSHIARRLVRLGREHVTAWRTKHTIGGLAGFAGLLVLTAGWQFAQTAAPPLAPAAVATSPVVVQAAEQKPMPETTGAPTIKFSVPSVVAAAVNEDGIQPNRFDGKILKVYAAKDGEAIFHAYVVTWKGYEVVVEDPLAKSNYKEGDTIKVLPMNLPFPENKEPHRLLHFSVVPNRNDLRFTKEADWSVLAEKMPPQKIESKVLKVYAAKEGEAISRAYVVAWKGYEVIVEDPLARTHYKEGDPIAVQAMNLAFPQNREPYRLLKFVTGFAFSSLPLEQSAR
jgi:beta-lactamase regulating signal transducer with metallopeptidase domain